MANPITTYYSKYSPYSTTLMNQFYLDVINFRTFPFNSDDVSIQVPTNYHNRPDLLSQDAYGDPRLWWVFAVRNPDTVQDPIYDIVAGMTLIIPKKSTLIQSLGIQ